MITTILVAILVIIVVNLVIQAVQCRSAVKKAQNRLANYSPKTIQLSYGNMTYVDRGSGDVVLCAHGMFGGYDQAYDMCNSVFESNYRIIAPSRFGYLGSDVWGEGGPKEQAAAYAELLDKLCIEKTYIMGGSAGGTVAIRFALDYPERTKGVILYSSAMPYEARPEKYSKYAGPPAFLCNDYAIFLLSPLFKVAMSMEPSTIDIILPVSERKVGVVLDASKNNPDMARNFDEYPIENIKCPVLILHAKDDKLALYSGMESVLHRFKNHTLVSFESGGHMMTGHDAELKIATAKFTSRN